jgi:parvulin-like peptidyl-prolyl isomerase
LSQSPPALQRIALQQKLADLQQQEKEYQDYLQRLHQLHTFLEARKNKVELQVRAFRDADTTQIDLLVANTSPDEP